MISAHYNVSKTTNNLILFGQLGSRNSPSSDYEQAKLYVENLQLVSNWFVR